MPTLSAGLGAEARSRLEALLSRRWSLPPQTHPLARLQDRRFGPYRLLSLLGPKNNVGARYFQLYLVHRQGRLSREPLALGLCNSGPFPGYNWLELTRYHASVAFDGDTLDLAAARLDRRLFLLLSELVPPGGHLMVEYESPTQRDSERILTLGYPPVSSPLGYLLFRAGCRSFRDWYIAEGGREGPRKLQGFKPLDAADAAAKTARLRRELSALLAHTPGRQHGEWGRTARRLAQAVLKALEKEQNTSNIEQEPAGPHVP